MKILQKHKHSVITAVNIGSILEWYELGLFAYWAPTFSKIFFSGENTEINLILLFVFQALGYLIRPIGGVVFGRLGDRIGRKKTLIFSILCMAIPTLALAFLPTYASIGLAAPILLCIIRILQSFPAGGELPGSFCYLYECSPISERKYYTSWGFVGNQIGFIFAILECILFEIFLPEDAIFSWGWRLSFFIAALMNPYGFYLRSLLKETPIWSQLEKNLKISRQPVIGILSSYKTKILQGIGYSVVTSVSFGSLISFFPTYFGKFFGTSYLYNLWFTLAILVITTIPLTFFGRLADKFNYKKIVLSTTILIIAFLSVLFFFDFNFVIKIILCFLLTLCFSCLYAILPYLLTQLFPANLRFTGVGLTFNIADSFEGLIPVVALYLAQISNKQSAYYWILITCSFISLFFYSKIKIKRTVDN